MEIATAIEHIGIYSLKTNQLDDFYNFIANAVFCLDSSNSYSTVFWGCQLLINATKSKIDKESNRILKMIRDILDSISHAITHEDIPEHAKLQIVSFISSLSWVKVAAAQNKHTEILDLMNKITAKRVRVMVRHH